MAIQTPESDSIGTAAYGAFGTMKNAIDGLAQGVHERIDRTAFPGLSGGAQTALLAGLRFLGLISADGTPTPALHALAVPDEEIRKKHLQAIIREKHVDLFALNLTKTTPALLAEKMGESYNVTGSTRDKAVRFFLSALEYLEIPIPPLFKRIGNGTASPGRKRRAVTRQKPPTEAQDDDDEGESPIAPSGMTRTVSLKSGGTLTVSVSLDVWSLSESDQEFIFDLVKKVKAYEVGGKSEERA